MIKLKIHQMLLVWLFRQILFLYWISVLNSRVWFFRYNFNLAHKYLVIWCNHLVFHPFHNFYHTQNQYLTHLDQIFVKLRQLAAQKPINSLYFLVIKYDFQLLLLATMFYALNLKDSIKNHCLKFYSLCFLTPHFNFFQ